MKFFPIFLNVTDHPCVVIGGGNTATRKIDLLLQAHAKVHVVSPDISNRLQTWRDEGYLTYRQGEFQANDVQHARLVIAATDNSSVNLAVAEQAKAHNIPVNVVDQPDLSDFIVPSVLSRPPLQVAISSGGGAPVLARLLRARLETVIPNTYGALASFMSRFRDLLKQRFNNTTQRRDFWENVLQGPIAEMILSGRDAQAEQALHAYLDDNAQAKPRGEVYLVGGGPGDPDLLTFRALRLMQQADVVVYDRLISPAVLALVRREAEHIYVGKKTKDHTLPQQDINALLARLAKEGKKVLRLKGGDPFIFGRGGEEVETLLAEGIPFQVVPGITAALGASSYAGIPLTHRDYAQSCVFVTGHLKDDSVDLNWTVLVQPQQTVVVYMGLRTLEIFCHEMIAHGCPPERPAALVQKATTADQKALISTVASLPEQVKQAEIHLQSVIIVGDVVKLHHQLSWFVPPPNDPQLDESEWHKQTQRTQVL